MKELINCFKTNFQEGGLTRRDYVLGFIGTILFFALCILCNTLN